MDDKMFQDKLDEVLMQADVPYVLIFVTDEKSAVRSNLEDTEEVLILLEDGVDAVKTGVKNMVHSH